MVAELLASRPVDRLRTAGRILRLAEHYTPERLEAACKLGLAHGDAAFRTLKRILHDGLETMPMPAPVPASEETCLFARDPNEFSRSLLGGAAWN